MGKYIPHPKDTEGVVVSDEILSLAEEMARNTHEVWAKGKLDDGWTYGETVDAVRKTHPSLVEYEKLTESEKDYDRRTSLQAVKFVLSCGYKIVKE